MEPPGAPSPRASRLGSDGSVFVTGDTSSSSFPTTSGAYQTTYQGGSEDAFVAKLTPTGSVSYSTFLGGSGIDDGFGIGVDQSDNQAVVVGQTQSSNFPTLDAAQSSLGSSGTKAFRDPFERGRFGTGVQYVPGRLQHQLRPACWPAKWKPTLRLAG